MRSLIVGAAALVAALGMAGETAAAPCYVIYDRDDVVVFRDVVPPFDLSNAKSPERMAMRSRGQLLLIAEFDKCDPAGYISATTGGTTATVDDIVMSIKPMIGASTGGGGTYVAPPQTASARGNAPQASVVHVVPTTAK